MTFHQYTKTLDSGREFSILVWDQCVDFESILVNKRDRINLKSSFSSNCQRLKAQNCQRLKHLKQQRHVGVKSTHEARYVLHTFYYVMFLKLFLSFGKLKYQRSKKGKISSTELFVELISRRLLNFSQIVYTRSKLVANATLRVGKFHFPM